MFTFTKIKNSFFTHNRLKNQSTLNLLGAMPFDKETDYKIDGLSSLAYPLSENKELDNDDIRDAITNMPNLVNEVELRQMDIKDFYQLSYMDCLPDVVYANEKSKSKKLVKKPKI